VLRLLLVNSIMRDSVAHVRRLDCSSLAAGALLCTGVSPTATCGFRVFTTSGTDTCLSIRTAFGSNGAPIPFSLFGALNNGVLTMVLAGAEIVDCHEHGTRTSAASVRSDIRVCRRWPAMHLLPRALVLMQGATAMKYQL